MFGEKQTRALLGPADPVRNTVAAAPRLSASELIHHADVAAGPAVARRRTRAIRRLVVTAGTLAVAVAAVAIINPFDRSTVDNTTWGPILTPIAYEFDTDPVPAGPELRALADKLVNTPYDDHIGRYSYHETRIFGDPVATSADQRYHVAFSRDMKLWQLADGSGLQLVRTLRPEFPDQASQNYWATRLEPLPSTPQAQTLPPMPAIAPLPSDATQLRDFLDVQYGAGAVPKQVGMVYGRYTVPLPTRALILRILADVPGFVWRGEVTDRAGRAGMAITFDDRENDQQHLLIFNQNTGELLAHERVTLFDPVRINTYLLILDTDRTDSTG